MAPKEVVPEAQPLFSSHQDVLPLDIIRARHFSIAGCGALGTMLARILARLGAHRFHLIDGHKVEEQHLNREVFGHDQVGTNKAAALSYQLGRIHRKIRCVTSAKELASGDLVPGKEDLLILTTNDVTLPDQVLGWLRDWKPADRPSLWVGSISGLRGGYWFCDLKREMPDAAPQAILGGSPGAAEHGSQDKIATTAHVVAGLMAQAIGDRLMTRDIKPLVTVDLGDLVRG